MKKLLLAVFAFSLAISASAGDWEDGRDVEDSLKRACYQCEDANCKAQVNLTKTNIIASRPQIADAYYSLRSYKCY